MFWNMSLPEIEDTIESYVRQEERQKKQNLLFIHFAARDIGQYVNLVLNGSEDAELKELWDFFPELFKTEQKEAEKQRREQQLAVYKAQMKDFVARHNNKQKEVTKQWKA